jgi:hypothetical protein
MTEKKLPLILSLAALLCSLWCVWRVHSAEENAPGVGEVMSGVQLHFAKLFYAHEAKNAELADFELGEIEENLDRAAQLRPSENGTNLGKMVAEFKKGPLAAMKNGGDFRAAYGQAIQSCNACHQGTGHPYIVICEPKGPPVSNQVWGR